MRFPNLSIFSLLLFFLIYNQQVFAQCGINNNIGGTIFLDVNSNGIGDEEVETGIQNITITAYDNDGNTLVQTTSNGDGNYVLLVPNGEKVRVEFTNLPFGYSPSFEGANNGTSVQFIQSPTCTADFGVVNESTYCEENPRLALPCFVSGDPLLGGDIINRDAFVALNYDATGSVAHLAVAEEIGSTWGMIYDRRSETAFVSSFIKRHSGFGPMGIGGIYQIGGVMGATGTVTNFLDLAPCLSLTDITRNDLPANAGEDSYDTEAYENVGKKGLGALTMNDDGTTIWTIDLEHKTLVKIPIRTNSSDVISVPACGDIDTYNLPNQATAEMRPFAVEYFNGKIYIGEVMSTSLSASVYEFDPVLETFSGSILSFSLQDGVDIDKGCATFNEGCEWFAWDDTYPTSIQGYALEIIYPQPMFTDIEFDANGSMVLGFTDRFAHQTGFDITFDPNSSQLYHGNSGGDIYFAYNDNGTYVLEEDGDIVDSGGNVIHAGCGNTADSGIEFFCGEDWEGTHKETAVGSLAIHPAKGETVITSMDPVIAFSGGLAWLSNTTGQDNRGLTLVSGPASDFGKAASFGDLELLCGLAPIEIGNYVWDDQNGNGRQDPNEPPIENISVLLMNSSSSQIASTTTDANGYYTFNSNSIGGLTENETYYIVIGNYNAVTGVNGSGYLLTTSNASGAGFSDINDSDGIIDGSFTSSPYVQITTGSPGENNHDYDFGFGACLAVSVETLSCNFNGSSIDGVVRLNITASANASLDITPNGGSTQSITADGDGNATLDLTVDGDGSMNPITINDTNDGDCDITTTYSISGNLSISNINNGVCSYDTANLSSESTLSVTVDWSDLNGNNDIIVEVGDQSQTFSVTTESGSQIVTFTVAADGSTNNLIHASVDDNTYACTDVVSSYNAQSSCVECVLQISNVVNSNCEYDGVGLTSSSTLSVEVYWANADEVGSLPQTIEVNAVTAGGTLTETISVTTSNGSETVTFNVPADGSGNYNITTEFANDGGCSNASIYTAMSNCPVRYDLAIVKEVDNYCPNISDAVTFTVQVVNEGEATTTGVIVEDVLPSSGITYSGTHTVSTGSFNGVLWTVGSIGAGEVETLTVTVTANQSGVFFNDAQINAMTEVDVDSSPDNDLLTEDDMDDACFSVPFEYCDGDTITVQATSGLYNYQWYKDGVAIGGETEQSYDIVAIGDYHYTADFNPGGGDEFEMCCPVKVNPGTCNCFASITSADILGCVESGSNTDLILNFEWGDLAVNDVLTINADGVNDTYVVTSTSGSASITLSVPTGNGNGVPANISVNGKPSCTATNTTYDSPSNCNCNLSINGISEGACSYNAITEASEFLLTYTVNWTDGIVGESIEVEVGGTLQNIYIATQSGSATRQVIARADGASNTLTATLTGESGCSQTANYTAVNPCPPCNLEINYVNVLFCENDGVNSTQDIEVAVEWLYASAPDVITVTIDGQDQTLNVTTASGTGLVTFADMPADGSVENVTAAFNGDSACSANTTYTSNDTCPNCTLTLDSSSIGDCSYDPTDQDNTAVLTVNVSWTNAFNGEFLNIVTQDSISTTISTGSDYAAGSTTANLTVPATGQGHTFTAYLGANYDKCLVENEAYTAPDDCIEYDWGDAPDTYLTDNVGATEGPSHALRTGLFIGDLVDSEGDGVPATTGNAANGDDNASGNMTVGTAAADDEEGISSFPALSASLIGDAYTVNVNVTNTTGTNASLIGWVDFDNDGVFSSNEAVSASVPNNSNDITVALAFTVPSDLQASFTYARFRLTTDSSITVNTPGGIANDGEVEDYEITISCPSGKCGRVTVVRN